MTVGTLIVGGGIAAVRCAERLRRAGDTDPVTIVAAEDGLPYDRPPLSKQALLDSAVDRPVLKSSEALDALGVRLLQARHALRLHRAERRVDLDSGESLSYDDLVIATGSVPRRLPLLDDAAPHYLRTWDDALRLRNALRPASGHVLVVGAGVLGLEIAATSRALGHEVTVVDAAPRVLPRLGGPGLSEIVMALHEQHGVRFALGVTVGSVIPAGDGAATLALSDGTRVDADVVVVAIGAVPATGWLHGSELAGHDGVETDAACRTRDDRIFAIGDVARVERSPGVHERLEHWTSAGDTAAVAARNILARRRDEPPVQLEELPYVWSDQFDGKLQILGTIGPDDDLLPAVDDTESGRWLRLASREGNLVGVVGWNMPAAVNRCRTAIAARAAVTDVVTAAPWERMGRP
ncbi:FAD-dependent oxidoreductase [Aeromicrobium camelliae]|uniref:FAD-dependent oxidoreductase n=1 Tax=Aeromicrobium camelliae TaxID=1538144 RepID=A0A3N6YGN8_9ACTN|nr:FAD-dependent oxidoreductase [Aeromicrobium camelliae]RQN08944.1 FAD-dependent oxidoreductase [Aeromicrobium camelliae]